MKPEYLVQIPYVFLGIPTAYLLFGLLAIAIGIILRSYFMKVAELKAINDNFSTVLEQQTELKNETGKIQNALDKDHTDFRVKHELFHQQSIKSIIEIYDDLLKIRKQADLLQISVDLDKAQKFHDSVRNFRESIERNRIWIASDISELIESTAINIENTATKFITSNKTEEMGLEKLTEAQIEKLIQNQEDFYDLMVKSTSIFTELAAKVSEHYKSG